ncbi:MAG: hypothetical protein V3V08_19715 [Nannocystaceae bacterium]
MGLRRRERSRRRFASGWSSALETAELRFLLLLLEHVLGRGLRSAADLLHFFPPGVIGRVVGGVPRLRVAVLAVVAGLTEEKAASMGPEETARLLETAFAEGDATPDLLLQLLTPADCVRHLDGPNLWRFASDHGAWRRIGGGDLALRRIVASLLVAAVDEHLIRHEDVVERIGATRLALWVPPDQIAHLLQAALARGDTCRRVAAAEVASAVSLAALARAAPPRALFGRVIVPLLDLRMIGSLPRRSPHPGR